MTKKIGELNFKNLLKAAWVTAVLLFLAIYLYRHWSAYLAVLIRIPPVFLLVSALSLFIAKGFLALNMKFGAEYAGVSLKYLRVFYIYTITQIAKYIPGSIWHVVGRIGFYKEAGLSNKAIRESMIIEHLYILGSAFILGSGILFIFNYAVIIEIISKLKLLLLVPVILAAITAVIGVIFRKYITPIVSLIIKNPVLNIKMTVLEIFIWTFLGLYFAALVFPFAPRIDYLVYYCGLFAISYFAGFIIPIAPAGIGVREAIMVIGLSPVVSVDVAITVSTLSRAVFVLVELVLSVFFIIFDRFTVLTDLATAKTIPTYREEL